MSAWHASDTGRNIPVAWLSLDADDNNLERFLAYLIAPIGTIQGPPFIGGG
jgi:ATP/maltotriose-dependent transcriptional regulator MalT